MMMRVIIVIIAEGRLSVNTGLAHNITEAEVIRNNPEILPGGKWRPRDCVARHKVRHGWCSALN